MKGGGWYAFLWETLGFWHHSKFLLLVKVMQHNVIFDLQIITTTCICYEAASSNSCLKVCLLIEHIQLLARVLWMNIRINNGAVHSHPDSCVLLTFAASLCECAAMGNQWSQKRISESLEAAAFWLEQEHLLNEFLSYLYTCSLACKIPKSANKIKEKGKKGWEGVNWIRFLFIWREIEECERSFGWHSNRWTLRLFYFF